MGMRATPLLAALMATCAVPAAGQIKEPIVDGRVNVRENIAKPVFLADQWFYPGETVTLEIDDKIDAMRWMYEDRECWSKTFGLFCHYVNRSDGSGLGESEVPLVLDLYDFQQAPGAVAITPAMVSGTPYDASRQLASPRAPFQLTLNDPEIASRFSAGFALYGKVADRVGHPGGLRAIARQDCNPHRNQEHCSQGEYVVRIKSVNADRRFAALQIFLGQKRRIAELGRKGGIDDWLLFKVENFDRSPDEPRRKAIAALLLKHVGRFYQVSGSTPEPDRLAILELARSLDLTNPSIGAAIVQTQLASGDISGARSNNNKSLRELQGRYDLGDRSEIVIRGLAEALYNAATIQLRHGVIATPGDTRLAVDFFSESADMWQRERDADGADQTYAVEQYVLARSAQAHAGSTITDIVKIDDSIAAMRDARAVLPLERSGTATAVAIDGTIVAATTDFTHVAQIIGDPDKPAALPLNAAFAFTPDRLATLVDNDARGGHALFRNGDGVSATYRRVDAVGTSAQLPLLAPGVALTAPRIGASRIVAIDAAAGELVRFAPARTVLAPASTATRFAVARDGDVVIASASGDATDLMAYHGGTSDPLAVGSGGIDSLAVSRDGVSVAIVVHGATGYELRIKNIAPGAPPAEIVALPGNDAIGGIDFTVDASQVLLLRGQSLQIVMRGAGAARTVQLGGTASRLAPLWDDVVALPLVDGDRVTRLQLLAAGQVTTGTIDDQLATAHSLFKLAMVAPSISFAPLVRDPAQHGLTLAVTTSGSETMPVQLQAIGPLGRMGQVTSATDWRPGTSFAVGPLLAVNPVATRAARLYSSDGTEPIVFTPAAGERTEIVSLGAASIGSYGVITYGSDGGVRHAAVWDAGGHLLKDVALDFTSGRRWRFLPQPIGPVTPDQRALSFVAAQDAGRTLAVMTIAANGTTTTAASPTTDGDHVVGRFADRLIRRTADALVMDAPGGTSTTLAQCVAGDTICDLSFYEPVPGKLVAARRSETALHLDQWRLDGGALISATCSQCALFDAAGYVRAVEQQPVGFAFPAFALAAGDQAVMVAVPTTRGVRAGALDAPVWSQAAPGSLPVSQRSDVLAVQDGAKLQLWRSTAH